MPADYNSTARALALPVSPPRTPNQSTRTSWQRSTSSSSARRNYSSNDSRGTSFRDKVLDNAERFQRQVFRTVKKLSPLQRFLAGLVLLTSLVLTILFFIYNERIFAWLEPIAERWKNLRGGWLIIWFMIFVTAFPPLIGYSTCVTIAGFVYGFPNGWFIVASATILGSLTSFLVSRTILSGFAHRLVSSDSRFAALSLVLKHDGLRLLIMIRLCPLPYSLSNGALSTFPTVKPAIFALATTIASPKLMIHVFIGSRLAAIARNGEKMDKSTKIINYASIVGGMIFGAATGYLIYQRTVARSRELEAEENNAQKTRRGSRVRAPSSFSEDPVAAEAGGEVPANDVIDFLDPGDGDEYQDDFEDDEGDIDFRYRDEEGEGIGLDKRTGP